MFSTILKEVTGYFDRRALISAFFPSLVFWGVTLISVVAVQLRFTVAVQQWEGLGTTMQAILLIAFFVWVAFWAFLTLNFRTALMRLYEGYWPSAGLLAGRLFRWRRDTWQAGWDELDSRDRDLEARENALLAEKDAYEKLRRSLAATLSDAGQSTDIASESEESSSTGAAEHEQEIDSLLDAVESALDAGTPSASTVVALGEQVRHCWHLLVTYLKPVLPDPPDAWRRRRGRLDALTRRLEATVEQQLGEVEEKRLRLTHDLFLYYPPRRDDVMPTRLGNVLKAAERYAQERYHLDAVVIWSRLQSALPTEFSDPLQDAKTSLDLMVTLSALTVLFGLPLSGWVAINAPAPLLWWIPLLLASVALPLRFYVAGVVALVAFILTLMVGRDLPALIRPSLSIVELQHFLTYAAGVLLLAHLSYENAVQAGLAYSEKIKAAFDLYRWKVLEALHLQLPPNFEEERRLWEEVCGLLYRGYTPDARYYRYVEEDGKTKAPVSPPKPTRRLPVPATALAPFHVIGGDDIVEMSVLERDVPEDAVRDRARLIEKCALTRLPAGVPVSGACVADPERLKDTVAIGISATPAMAQAGALRTGDVVDITFVPASDGGRSALTPICFEDMLVLDVTPVPVEEAEAVQPSYVVVVAVPVNKQSEFVTHLTTDRMVLVRRVPHDQMGITL